MRIAFLICGIAVAFTYIAMDVAGAMLLYPGYDIISQQVSELSAVGAPTRAIWVVMSYPLALLNLAFATGIWLTSRGQRSLRIAAGLVGLFAINNALWVLLAPMHMRGTEFTATDTMHIIFTVVAVVLLTGFIGFGAAALGRTFRIYSALTILAMMAGGAVVSTRIVDIAENRPTPWMGLVERISVHGPTLWLAVFAFLLILRELHFASSPYPQTA